MLKNRKICEDVYYFLLQSQAAALITKIMTCTPHYVRCIKPSESKKPLDWDDQRFVGCS